MIPAHDRLRQENWDVGCILSLSYIIVSKILQIKTGTPETEGLGISVRPIK